MATGPSAGADATGTTPDQGGLSPEPPLTRLLGRWVATLDPGWFAWVMASGIISVGTELLGYHLLSDVSLWITEGAFVVLVAAYGARAFAYSQQFEASLRDPKTAMAFFTVVAGSNVLGIRLVMAGHPLVGLGLGAGAVLIWLLLTYGLPGYTIAGAHHPVLGDINGTWLVWVVATQSLAIIAAGLAPVAPWSSFRQALPIVAVAFWSVGIMLYLVLIVVILLRLLLVELTPGEMGPAYWIAMGATAISVRAAAGILVIQNQPGDTLVRQMRPLLVDLSVVLWAFGTWWIPLLVLLGIWRHVLRRYPLSLRAQAVERGVPARHVHGGLGEPGARRQPRLLGDSGKRVALGRGGRLGGSTGDDACRSRWGGASGFTLCSTCRIDEPDHAYAAWILTMRWSVVILARSFERVRG